jgi:hypothetical protein
MRNLLVVSAVALLATGCALPPLSARTMARAYYPPTREGAPCDSVRARNLTLEQLAAIPDAARPRLMETPIIPRSLPMEDPSLAWQQWRGGRDGRLLPPARGRQRANIEVLVDYAGFVDPRSISVTGLTDLAAAKDIESGVRQARFFPGVAEGCAINWPEPLQIVISL